MKFGVCGPGLDIGRPVSNRAGLFFEAIITMKLPPTISLRLLPAALLLLYILIIGQDYLSSVLRDTGFFWPDVLLFNTYWLLFWPFARCWRGIEVKHPHKGGLLARIAAMLNTKCTVMKVFPIGGLLFVSLFLVVACTGQKDLLLRPGTVRRWSFEMGEFIFYGMPEQIPAADTSPGLGDHGGTKTVDPGRVLLADGVTPAPGVILYYYHTDTSGVYLRTKGMDQRAAPHGYIRGGCAPVQWANTRSTPFFPRPIPTGPRRLISTGR